MGRGSNDTGFIDLVFEELSPREMSSKAESFYQEMNKRRTTRHFSTRDVSRSLIEAAFKTAGTAPSGAHLQPWTFVAISNQELKQRFAKRPKKRRGKHTLNGCRKHGLKFSGRLARMQSKNTSPMRLG